MRKNKSEYLINRHDNQYEVVIGLEVHAQVTSQSKLFSTSATKFGAEPNTQVSLVDAAFPGMLPVINEYCVKQAIKTGIGLKAKINKRSVFDRKNYFYADLPQGYQISQFKDPIVGEGKVILDMPDGQKEVGIERLHLEQDAGKSIHDLDPKNTFVDLNRSGVALMEIVSKPDLRSPDEVNAYIKKLRSIMRYLGTCDGNMQEGSLRADVNVSVRKKGSKEFGTRCEIKNVNSIKFMQMAIELFKPEEFWTLSINFQDKNKSNITASITQLDGEKIEKFSFKNKEEIEKAIDNIKNKKFNITDISSKVVSRNPSGPFTTSTLQQVASSRLGFGASRTMQIAQKLYQGIEIEGDTVGLITYMRTDGTNLSADAVSDFRNFIKKEYGNEYLPENANNYSGKKAKNAQEAHEAIRPTDINRNPDAVKKYLSSDQQKLYSLIWSRALSSQMETAKFDRNTITIESEDGKTICKSSGSILKFDGFLKVYSNQNKDDDEQILPEMSKGPINIEALIDEQHFTQPPPRYSEASLVKKLEELGIGRPSTYASIISTIANRGYAEIVNKRFFPTDRGKLISAFLEKLFSKYVDYNFTAGLEDQLDEITSGKESWLKVLEMFWKDFNSNVSEVKEKRTREVLDLLNESLGALIFDTDKDGKIVRKCQLCDTGSLSLKNSFRGGAFIGCSNYPECKFTRPLSKAKAAAQSQLAEPKFLGKHENGNDIFLKNGRFGPYLQYEKVLEENIEEEKPKKRKKTKKKKPEVNELLKNVSIPKGIELESIDIDKAKFLCSLPKSLGINPENQKEITLNTGRFGPYLKCENKSARIENVDEIFFYRFKQSYYINS